MSRPSAMLYAEATSAELLAQFAEHTEEHHRCYACHLAAKARLYVRAGDAAAQVADGFHADRETA